MQLEFRIPDIAFADAFRGYIERRLRFCLNRFGSRVSRAAVNLKSREGAHSATEWTCSIRVRLVPPGTVLVRETSADLFVAVDRGVGRLERLVTHRLQRARAANAGRATEGAD